MTGLELAERYFTAYGLPLLRDSAPEVSERAAAGLIGLGSECLGFDDDYSRDHDWGPGFCLWLGRTDYERYGAMLSQAYQGLPEEFEGFRRQTSEWGEGRVGIFETGRFYGRLIGRTDPPETVHDWLRLQEASLSTATAGKVFYDPSGEFSRFRRTLLDFYPEDVRLVRIAARCMVAGQSGQYNFIRSLQRDQPFALQYAETKFCADVMSLLHLLNRCYAPYYKWLVQSTRELPLAGPLIAGQIGALVSSTDREEKLFIMEGICAAVIALLQAEGLSDSTSRFLVDHGPVVHQRINAPELRSMNVWLG